MNRVCGPRAIYISSPQFSSHIAAKSSTAMGTTTIIVVLLSALTSCVIATLDDLPPQNRVPKQIHTKAAVVDTDEDHKPAETHFGGGEAHGHGKYFMDTIMIQTGPHQVEFGHVCEDPHEWEQRYERRDLDAKRFQGKHEGACRYQHVPHKDHYEFGFRRGNEHHFKERYEKAHPHHGQFKTKARWGDKHGGYGEHYWDYNHAGHHGDDGGSSDDAGDDGSEAVPQYQQPKEREPQPEHRQLLFDQEDRVKRDHKDHKDHQDTKDTKGAATSTPTSTTAPLSLAYDEESGTVVNEATGQRFLLQPLN